MKKHEAGLGEAAKPETADAVQDAHEQGIIHRDLKPANILLQTAGTASGVARVHAKG